MSTICERVFEALLEKPEQDISVELLEHLWSCDDCKSEQRALLELDGWGESLRRVRVDFEEGGYGLEGFERRLDDVLEGRSASTSGRRFFSWGVLAGVACLFVLMFGVPRLGSVKELKEGAWDIPMDAWVQRMALMPGVGEVDVPRVVGDVVSFGDWGKELSQKDFFVKSMVKEPALFGQWDEQGLGSELKSGLLEAGSLKELVSRYEELQGALFEGDEVENDSRYLSDLLEDFDQI